MPPLERMDLLDVAVFWPLKMVDGYTEPIVGSPVELSVRWVHQESVVLTPDGQTIAVDSTVVCDDDVEQFAPQGGPFWVGIINGIFWQGSLLDLPGTGFPGLPVNSIMQCKSYQRTEDIKARHVRRVCGLLRFNDTMPTIVP